MALCCRQLKVIGVECAGLLDHWASIADSGPALSQHWVFHVNSRNPLNATFHHLNKSYNHRQTE